MARQVGGYAIVLRSDLALARYSESAFAKEDIEPLARLRQALGDFDPARYQGSGRDFLEPYLSLDERMIREHRRMGLDLDTNRAARMRFKEITGEGFYPDRDENIFERKDDAFEVHALLEDPDEFDIIEVNRESLARSDATLGYDVGYWAVGFSLICDSAIMPKWHPPDLGEGLDEFSARLRALNRHLLFDTVEAAKDFTEYYKARPWAEIEDFEGEFCVVRVDAVFT